MMRSVEIVACGSPPARGISELVSLAPADRWSPFVTLSPSATNWASIGHLERQTGYPVRTEFRTPDEELPGKPLRDRSRRMDVHLDGVCTNEAALVAELERKLGGRAAYQEITEIDLIHGHMLIDVRLRPGHGVIERRPQKTNELREGV